MSQLEERVRSAGVESSLMLLVKTRASQLNGISRRASA